MKLLEKIFSIKNIDTKKVITILGIKIKFKNKYKILQLQNKELENKLKNLEIETKKFENKLKNLEIETKEFENKFDNDLNSKTKKLENDFETKLQNNAENAEKLIKSTNKTTNEYLIKKLRENNYERLLADYKLCGFSQELLKEFETLARSKYCWLVENNNLWLLYMQVMIENDCTDELECTIKKYMHFHNLKGVENFPVVANHFYKQGYTNERIEKSSKIFEKLKASEGKFAELIKGKSIAVVGNGPVEVGKGHGQEIDNHDIVIRFNEFHTEGDYAKDYGSKTDVWVNYSANQDFCNFDKNIDCKLFLWIFDSLYFRRDIALENMFSVIDKEWDIYGIDTAKEIWNKYQFYHSPTTGFYLIMHLYNLRKTFENIDFYGFKFLETDNSSQLHYFAGDDSFEAHPWHNFDAEAEFLKHFINKT